MSHCHKEIYLHLVWATRQRDPLLTPEIERRIHRCIQSEAERLGAAVLAIGGLADHVHFVVQSPAHVSTSDLTKQVKGVSSRFAVSELVGRENLIIFFILTLLSAGQPAEGSSAQDFNPGPLPPGPLPPGPLPPGPLPPGPLPPGPLLKCPVDFFPRTVLQ